MKTLIWCVAGLLAVFWTAGAWVSAEVAQWAAQLLASGAAADLGQAAARWPIPESIAAWLHPAWAQWLQSVTLPTLEALRSSMPFLGSVLSWLGPIVWVIWALGMFFLLALTLLALWLAGWMGTSGRRRSETAAG